MTIYSPKDEQALMSDLWTPSVADRPLSFVEYVYPWGKEGTPLAQYDGPRKWQRASLIEMGEHMAENRIRMELGLNPLMFRGAWVSGRGPGKTALVAWIIHWFMSTRIGGTCIATANTENQIKSKTWAELGRWHALAINGHWFERSALSYVPAGWYRELVRDQLKIDPGYYYAQAQLWSAENPDAFAGAHNPHGMLVIYDEASGIPPPIWDVTDGFYTEPWPYRFWLVFSNPRRNTGEFFECFHKYRGLWRTHHIDSRKVEGTDPATYQHFIDKYGLDHDVTRVEVLGEFPVKGDNQLIGRDIIQDAAERELHFDAGEPLILGIDVGHGRDDTVLRWRQGRDARSIAPVRFKEKNEMTTAYKIARWIDKTNPDAVCMDSGWGTGVINRLRELRYRVIEVGFGKKAEDPQYANVRTELWHRMRDWLPYGCIDDDPVIKEELAGPEVRAHATRDQIILETKDEMRKRIGADSPNDGDSLAITFFPTVARRDLRVAKGYHKQPRVAKDLNYDIFG